MRVSGDATARVLTLLSQIDFPLLIPSLSAIQLCTVICPYQQSVSFILFTTTVFEVFRTIRCLRQMEATVRSGSHHTLQQFSVPTWQSELLSRLALTFPRAPASPLPLLPSFD
jgi:hypothetical protein